MIKSKEQIITNRKCCPICSSKNRSILFSAKHNSPGFLDFIKFEKYYSKNLYVGYATGPLGEMQYEIAECHDCFFVYLTEVLNDLGVELLYNEWLEKNLLKLYYSTLPYNISEEMILKLIKNYFRQEHEINLMDFGAGYGNFCSIAIKLGFNAYAFDLSTDKNDHMNSRGVTIINNFDKHYGYFQFIWVNQVFEHLSDPLEMLIKLKRCLADQGLIYLGVPDCKHLKRLLKEKNLSEKLFKLLSPHQHINAFNNSSLKLLGSHAGLKSLSRVDFLRFFNILLNFNELRFLIKKTIKNASYGTGLFFKKK